MTGNPQYIEGKKFHWGNVTKHHNIGEYLIVEYVEKNTSDISFHVYIHLNGTKLKDTHTSYESLDEALLGCLEYKYRGLNSQFTYFAYRMLEMDKKDK